MLYSHFDIYPENIVHQFAESCKNGELDKLDSFFPPKENIFQKIKRKINGEKITRESHILEYEYAFWFGLNEAAKGNQVEAIKYILSHPDLKNFREKKEIYRIHDEFSVKKIQKKRSYQEDKIYNKKKNSDDDIIMFSHIEPDEISSIDVTEPIRYAAEYGSFESFEILKGVDVWDYVSIEEVYMIFFTRIFPDKLNKLLEIPNLNEILKNNLEKAVHCIVDGKNEYALRVLKDYFKVNIDLIVKFIDSYDYKFKPKQQMFRTWALMELNLSSKEKGNSIIRKI